MALQPTRRQKRPIVLSSDDDEDLVDSGQCFSETVNCSSTQLRSKRINGDIFSSQPLPKRSRPRTRSSTSKSHPSTLVQSTSSEFIKNLPRGNSKGHKTKRTESLHPYLSAAAIKRRQAVSRNIDVKEAENDHIEEGEEVGEEDVIEDDVSELGFPRHTSLRSTTKFVLDRRKQHPVSTPKVLDPTSSERHQNSSQAFAIPKEGLSDKLSLNTVNSLNHEDSKPWAEKFGPTGLEELTVHKKKVADVRNWMEKFWQGGNQKVNGCVTLLLYEC